MTTPATQGALDICEDEKPRTVPELEAGRLFYRRMVEVCETRAELHRGHGALGLMRRYHEWAQQYRELDAALELSIAAEGGV